MTDDADRQELAHWFTGRPTTPGFYWHRFNEGDRQPIIVEVTEHRTVEYPGGIDCGYLDRGEYDRALWCGPLPAPSIP